MARAAFLFSAAAFAQAQDYPAGGNGTVYLTNDKYSFVPGVLDKSGVAYATFTDMAAATESGGAFGSLSITTNPAYNDSVQGFAAGFVEGSLTYARIYEQYINMEVCPIPRTNEWG